MCIIQHAIFNFNPGGIHTKHTLQNEELDAETVVVLRINASRLQGGFSAPLQPAFILLAAIYFQTV